MRNPEEPYNEHEEVTSISGLDQPQLEAAPTMSILPSAEGDPRYVDIPETPGETARREDQERKKSALDSIDEIDNLDVAKSRLRGLTMDYHGDSAQKAEQSKDPKYEKIIASKDVDIGNLQVENSKLKSAVTPLQVENKRLQSEVSAEQAKVKPLQDEVTRLQAEITKAQDLFTKKSAEAAASTGQINSLKAQLADANRHVSEAENEATSLQQDNARLTRETQSIRAEKGKIQSTVRNLQYALSTSLVVMSLALGGLGAKTLIDSKSGGERVPTEASSSSSPPKSLEEALGIPENQELRPVGVEDWYDGHLNKVAPIVEGQPAEDRYEVVTTNGALYVTDVGIRYGDEVHYRFVGPLGKVYVLVNPDDPKERVRFVEVAPNQ